MRQKILWSLLILLALTSMGLHWHLASQHEVIKAGLIFEDSFCTGSEIFDCGTVNSSKYSELFGISMGLWGFSTHLILFVLLIAGGIRSSKRDLFKQTAHVLYIFIALTSVVMFLIAKGLIGKLCLYCTILYVISFIQLGLSMFKLKNQKIPFLPRLNKQNLPQIFIVLSLLMLLPASAIAIQILNFETPAPHGSSADTDHNHSDHKGHDHGAKPKTADEIVGLWFASPKIDFNTTGALVYGAPSDKAKMTIKEFADFRCGHCAVAEKSITQFMQNKNDVRWIFMPFPLDGACNAAIQKKSGLSCELAKTSLCVANKPKGWEFHKYLFENQKNLFTKEGVSSTIKAGFKEFNYNAQEVQKCVASEETQAMIKIFTEQATKANVRGTPAIFVNGKRLPAGQRIPILEKVYQGLK